VAVVEGDDTVSVVVGDGAAQGDEDVAVVVATGAGTDVVAVTDEPPAEAPAEEDGGPPTEAVDMVTVTTDQPEEPPDPDPDEPPRRGLFGRRH
jgi:hypothetical protein